MMGFIITAYESKLWDTDEPHLQNVNTQTVQLNMYTHDKNNDDCLNDVHNNLKHLFLA